MLRESVRAVGTSVFHAARGWRLACAVTLLLVPSALADSVEIGASKDNTLYQSSTGSLSNGAGEHFFVGRTRQSSNSIRRALIAFDVAANIPSGSTVDSVELTLFLSRTRASITTVRLRSLLLDWGEGTSNDSGGEGSGTSATSGDATWIHTFFNTQNWTTPGGDFAPTVRASASVGGFGSHTWSSTPQMVADIQGWLDSPTSNFGWILIGNESQLSTAVRFDSRQNFSPGNRPVLTVAFTPPPTDACCDRSQSGGACTDDVALEDCVGDQYLFYPGESCSDVEARGACLEYTGACCDALVGLCTDGMIQSDCSCGHCVWTNGLSCGQTVCDAALGACCDSNAGPLAEKGDCAITTLADCDCDTCTWFKGDSCDLIIAQGRCEADFVVIPTVSEWGLLVLTLLLLVAAKSRFGGVGAPTR